MSTNQTIFSWKMVNVPFVVLLISSLVAVLAEARTMTGTSLNATSFDKTSTASPATTSQNHDIASTTDEWDIVPTTPKAVSDSMWDSNWRDPEITAKRIEQIQQDADRQRELADKQMAEGDKMREEADEQRKEAEQLRAKYNLS